MLLVATNFHMYANSFSAEATLMEDKRQPSTVDNSMQQDNEECDNVDMEALSSMLEQDSDMEGKKRKEAQKIAVNSWLQLVHVVENW